MEDIYSVVLEKILESMEKGIIPWKSPYFFHKHRNISGREYSGINVLLLNIAGIMENYELPVWLTLTQAEKKGWHVKDGEGPHLIIFFRRVEVKAGEKDANSVVDNGRDDYETKVVYCFRYYEVFNIQQLVEYPNIKNDLIIKNKENTKQDNVILENYIKNAGITFKTTECGVSYYMPIEDTIVMSPVRTRKEYLQTLAHEIIHSTGHPRRLGRFDIEAVVDIEEYSQEELVAEIGSSFLMTSMGETPDYQNSTSYIDGWAKYLKMCKKTAIFKAASDAQKACEYVLKIARIPKRSLKAPLRYNQFYKPYGCSIRNILMWEKPQDKFPEQALRKAC